MRRSRDLAREYFHRLELKLKFRAEILVRAKSVSFFSRKRRNSLFIFYLLTSFARARNGKGESERVTEATDEQIASEAGKRNARKRKLKSGGHNGGRPKRSTAPASPADTRLLA